MAHRDACAKGHRYTEATLAWRTDGTRRCRLCDKLGRDARRARQQLQAEAVRPPIGHTINWTGREPGR